MKLDDISIAIISLIRAGAVFRFVYCMVRLQGAEEEQAQYRKRAKNVAELEKQYDEASLWNGLTSKEAGPFQTEVRKVLVEVFGLYETKQGENKPGAEKKKLVVRSPFVWKNKGEF